ncbi:MAG: tetratricopeptide repeat protein [Terracidiphilus sp.]
MKRTISLWLGLLAFALLPAMAQTPAPTGKIHGHVTNPTGAPQQGGTVALIATTRLASGPGLTAQTAEKATFNVDQNGEYSGEAAPGIYKLVYRSPGMTPDKEADHIEKIEVKLGETIVQDVDMSRKEYIETLPPEQQKQLADLKAKNSVAMKANEIIKNINKDIQTSIQDFHDADLARATAMQQLGASASKADLDAKEAEIKQAKYSEVETLMLKDTAAKPDASVLWAQLGQAQVSLKKYDEAEASYKKALELETAAKKQSPSTQGAAQAGLGEVYARQGKVPEAQAAFDAAAKINPPGASGYLKNEAVIYFQMGNGDAQVAAADEAIKIDPTQPLPYYLRGQGLIGKATIDPKTGKMILPPGCAEAYQKYLELSPNGTYSVEVKAILTEASQTHSSAFGTDTPKKKK